MVISIVFFFIKKLYNDIKGEYIMDNRIPNHLGIIIDGNGRWAKERGLPRMQGHVEGRKALDKIVDASFERGIKVLSIFAFSTENFKRSAEEVSNLMDLLVRALKKYFKKYMDKNIKIVVSGRREGLSAEVLSVIDKVTEESKNNTGSILNLCWNYGGQFEILDMVKKISRQVADGKLGIDDIDLSVVEDNLYNKLPPMDFSIRTSGEQRTSGFMPYQAVYAEYYFVSTYFPDFDEKELDKALNEFSKRNRRFGDAK